MASLFKRAKDFVQSPQGKKLTEEVKDQASKPENRQQAQGVWTALDEEAVAPPRHRLTGGGWLPALQRHLRRVVGG